MSYCEAIKNMEAGSRKNLHLRYHDLQYGFPLKEDNEIFGRLILEINQAGLSWETILRKEAAFRSAYDDFDIAKIAAYSEADQARLMADAGIVRNRLKIQAAIHNAQVVVKIQEEHGSFYDWLVGQSPKTLPEWLDVFKRDFTFVGGSILNDFLKSSGFLPDAHERSCPIYEKVIEADPIWLLKQG